MLFVFFASLAFLITGIFLCLKAIKSDEVKQGMIGHSVFYLYMFAVATVAFGSLAGIKGLQWNIFIFGSVFLIFIARLLTIVRKFVFVTYFHLIIGLLMLGILIRNTLVAV